MAQNDQRRKRRTASPDKQGTLIEIRHTHGEQRKSIFSVNEFDEFGLSFLMPKKQGYFLPGTPLEFTLRREDRRRVNGYGIVKYYTSVGGRSGDTFYKVGLQIDNSYRDVMGGTYTIRPERYRLEDKNYDRSIAFTLNDTKSTFELIDVSRYSAAFLCNESEPIFRVSMAISRAHIAVEGQTLYQGPVTISHIYRDSHPTQRIVVEPRGGIINVDTIDTLETVSSAMHEASVIQENHTAYSHLNADFKAAVADLRTFLEEYRDFLESPRVQALHEATTTLLNELFPRFYDLVNEKLIRINSLIKKIKPSEREDHLYKAYYQKHLLSFLLLAPVNHRSYFKPEGYPGDYGIMRMLHEGKFEGATLLGKLLHMVTLTIPAGRVAKNRTHHLAGLIGDFASRKRAGRIRVFSVASGPALELAHLIETRPAIAGKLDVTLLDQEINALRFSQDALYEKRLTKNCPATFSFIHSTIANHLRSITGNSDSEQYDLIYSFGLFDYFDQKVARFILRCLLPHVKKGGRLIVSNASLESFHYRTFAEYGLDWYLVYRSHAQLKALATGLKGVKSATVSSIDDGIMKFLEIKC